ncbi:MAG: (2Fe-2S)-binding protein [Phycisphaerae bacterium]|nr:(2Fe-2S)-binding protein [Phycisphaerae bacterium]
MAESVRLIIDGEHADVPRGTSVAAAILNRGTWGFRRSVEAEVRGPLCGMGTCQECRLEINGEPHQRACMAMCVDGMVVRTGRASD